MPRSLALTFFFFRIASAGAAAAVVSLRMSRSGFVTVPVSALSLALSNLGSDGRFCPAQRLNISHTGQFGPPVQTGTAGLSTGLGAAAGVNFGALGALMMVFPSVRITGALASGRMGAAAGGAGVGGAGAGSADFFACRLNISHTGQFGPPVQAGAADLSVGWFAAAGVGVICGLLSIGLSVVIGMASGVVFDVMVRSVIFDSAGMGAGISARGIAANAASALTGIIAAVCGALTGS